MNRFLAAACAAVLLTGTLTACGSNDTGTANGAANGTTTGTANGTAGTAGTSYSVPGRVRYYDGANQDRTQYNATVKNRQRSDGSNNGRYTAYSDGTVSQGHGAVARDGANANGKQNQGGNSARGGQNAMDNGTNAMRDIGGGVGNAVGDIGNGVGSAMQNIGNGVGNAVRDITGQ